MSALIPDQAARIAARAADELEALVAVSTPSGDLDGAETAIALASSMLPPGMEIERIPCSTSGFSPDLLATLRGTGERRLLLLGHLDTVYAPADHRPMLRSGEHLIGSGTADMKGGVVLALGVARELAAHPDAFDEIAVLLVNDEEWRTEPFAHLERFIGYHACLCFEAGELTAEGEEAVVVRRKAASTLQVTARGRAAHSGSTPDAGRSALLALARTAVELAAYHDPGGEDRLSVVPTVMRSGAALNVVPAEGTLTLDMRAAHAAPFHRMLASIPESRDEVALDARLLRLWPGMDSTGASDPLLSGASIRLGRAIRGAARGGASDASHLAQVVPLTVDGLGPIGGHAHNPDEYIEAGSLLTRAEVALALAWTALHPAIL